MAKKLILSLLSALPFLAYFAFIFWRESSIIPPKPPVSQNVCDFRISVDNENRLRVGDGPYLASEWRPHLAAALLETECAIIVVWPKSSTGLAIGLRDFIQESEGRDKKRIKVMIERSTEVD